MTFDDDAQTVLLTKEEFDALPEYSTGRPPETPEGFVWKRNRLMKRVPHLNERGVLVNRWTSLGEDWAVAKSLGKRGLAWVCRWYTALINDEEVSDADG